MRDNELIMTMSSASEKYSATPTQNKALLITDKGKRDMIYSLRDLEVNKGRIYEVRYSQDYQLDEALNFDIDCTARLKAFVASHLCDKLPSGDGASISYDADCSAFACPDLTTGDCVMGRNFDFNHRDELGERIMIPLIVVHTAPEGGKKSVSFVDGQFIGYKSGFYTDGISDLSMLMALPYMLLDGINEDGFAVSVLKLDGKPTIQRYADRKKIFTTVAMRLLLDRASTVDEAIELLQQYNMYMDDDPTNGVDANYHFFMADAKGNYAIVEYTDSDINNNPSKMEVLRGRDVWRFATNFYVSPTMADTPYGANHSEHGKDRYVRLGDKLSEAGFNVSTEMSMEMLREVAQGPDGDQSSTGFTQWSEVFNLTKKEVTMSILREWNRQFVFRIEM